MKVECFIVSTAAVRLELETHNRRYWDTMSIILHSSILFDIANLNKFIEESISTLQQQSSSTKQVNNNHKKIIDASNKVKQSFILFLKLWRVHKKLFYSKHFCLDEFFSFGNDKKTKSFVKLDK